MKLTNNLLRKRNVVPYCSLVMDDSLAHQPEVFFESGDHECLIHMRGEDFMGMLQDAGHARFSRQPRMSSR